jgi:pyridoxal 5'-phosphate synthase pdxS subunit
MIRTKGEAGTGDVVEAVRHQRAVMSDIRRAASMSDEELYAFAKELSAPYHLLKETARLKRLPVVSYVFSSGRLEKGANRQVRRWWCCYPR